LHDMSTKKTNSLMNSRINSAQRKGLAEGRDLR
jgi:hypothetical protein